MSTLAATPGPSTAEAGGRGRWRPRRSTLAIVVGLVLAVLVVVLSGGGARTGDPLDPDNPGPAGAQAVARVLADQGVDVVVARGATALGDADVGPGTTVLVVRPDLVGEDALAGLGDLSSRTPVVVAGAGPGVSRALGLDALPSRVRLPEPRTAGCDDPLLGDLRVQVDAAYAYPGPGCFGDEGADGGGGALVVRDGDLTLLGAEEALTNDQVLRADNAALALRLLGQEARLVWYVPDPADLTGADGVGLRTLLPRWIEPGLWILGLGAIALLLWRGRRLGALAQEPLPVVVKAVETTDSLGRLYRRSGDRHHAATALREAARRRATHQLRLGRGAAPAEVVRAVAGHLGRREDDVAALLSPDSPAPTTDTDLVGLAADLAALDREVRHP